MTNQHVSDTWPKRVEIIDCTLRDGEQAPGLWLSVEEKLQLARLLSEAGVDVLDAGCPASSRSDLEAMQEMKRQGLRVSIAATARPVMTDIQAAQESRADEVFLVMPTSQRRIEQTLGMTEETFRMKCYAGAEQVVGLGMALNMVCEDAMRADRETIRVLVEEIRRDMPIKRLILADTVGCATPETMKALIAHFFDLFHPDIALCTHCHNDFGLATANSLAAVEAGASAITCTVNNIGERMGNADLAEVVAALTHLYQIEQPVDRTKLVELSALVEQRSGFMTSPCKPVTGFNVFRHESGIHVDGMIKDQQSYEFLSSAWLGRKTEYVLGQHSGTALIRHILEQEDIACDEAMVKALLSCNKHMTEQRHKVAHQAMMGDVQEFFRRELSGIDREVIKGIARTSANIVEREIP